MQTLKTTLTRSALDVLYYTSAYRAIEPYSRGVGVIFTLHHVRKTLDRTPFSPNRILEISTDFLDQTLTQIRNSGHDIISLDDVRQRLIERDFRNPFVCFTLDDGYEDNFAHALPIFSRHGAPFTVYVTTGLPDGTAILWWRHLEEIVSTRDQVSVRIGSQTQRFRTRTVREKSRAYQQVYWALRELPHEQQQGVIAGLLQDHGIDPATLCTQHAMSWEMVRELDASEWASIGAHTLNHFPMAKLSAREMSREADESRRKIAEVTGREPAHFAYPYGDRGSAGPREFEAIRELGFSTGTTTRKGVIFPEHVNHLHALPRVSLNGDYQSARFVRLFLSGAPFALARRFQRLDTH